MEALMLIGVAEGAVRSFEIDERAEGYLVRPRQRDTGQVEIEAGRVFRTVVAAFAFAEREALLEHYAAARLEGGPEGAMPFARDWSRAETLFTTISRNLADEGVGGDLLLAWAAYEDAQERRRLH
ncbi:hypothetical protein GCM10008026_03220 [Chelatococcus composti]|jgi:hypothetical protein|uniref:Uncharacterized protein n=2 Tax=Chelatococcus composti TaxID=1743235 RepID=A0A841K5E9_9HYPH|nr:hypothetical protein [Chelatococcus composti]MBB6166712.1 hypothetical protein [Chelatococcus composti]GGG26279.1 hypothetical protein GCM10008026_03220 [Chelatococcus composti]